MRIKTVLKSVVPALAIAASALGTASVAMADITMPYGTGTTMYSYENIGASPATIVASYYRPDGTVEPGSGATYNNVAQFSRVDITVGSAPDGPLPPNWKGSVVLSSDQDIIAVAQTSYVGRLNAEGAEPNSPAGTEASLYEAFNAGSTALYIPTIVRVHAANPALAQLSTRYTFQNTTGSATTLYLNYKNGATSYAPVVQNLNPYGSITYDTAIDSNLPDPSLVAPTVVVLSLYVTSTQPIVGVAEQSWAFSGLVGSPPVSAAQNWSADYNAIPQSEASTVLYGPLNARIGLVNGLLRPCTFANYATFQFYTQASIQNTGGATANVSAEFFRTNAGTGSNAPSGQAYYSTTFQLAPSASWNFNNFNAGNAAYPVSNPVWAALSDGYNAGTGAATHCDWSGSIRFTSSQPLVGFGFIQQPVHDQNYASGYNFFGAGTATSTAYLARYDRICTSTCTASLPEQFTDFSSLTVQNVGSATTNLTLQFYSAAGALVTTITTNGLGNPISIGAGQQYSFNSRNGADGSLAQTVLLGSNFAGSVKITASGGVPIRAFNNVLNGKIQADAYVGANR